MNNPTRAVLLLATVSALSAQERASVGAANSNQRILGRDRLNWVIASTVGPATLTGGVISAAWGTLLDSPPEYGPHWDGFGARYGMRLTGVATSNAMEAGAGAIWGEDPRYFRAAGRPFGERVTNVIKMTFLGRNREGGMMPAYGRYAAIAGNNFLSNAWRADSEATASAAELRILLGFLGRMSGNAFQEFWPDVRQRFRKKR